MQLILATDYAVRSVLYLAAVGRTATAGEISEQMNVPKQYLVTMARNLREAGIINAESGVKGGYSLGRPPEDISLFDIMKLTENTTRINRCLEEDKYCSCCAAQSCPTRGVFSELQGMIDSFFAGITLADLKAKTDVGKLCSLKNQV